MLVDKKRYTTTLVNGTARFNTDKMRGFIQHLIVKPSTDDMKWSMVIIDRDNDEIFDKRNHIGRLDDKDGLLVGKDKSEKITVVIKDTEPLQGTIKVIFKIREDS